jgi:hypothetical protein
LSRLQAQFNNKYLNVTITQETNKTNVWFWRFYVKAALADTTAPKELAQHAQPKLDYFPGDDISMAFDEPIDCSVLVASLLLANSSVISQSELLVLCSGNSVFLDFSPTMSIVVRECMLVPFCLLIPFTFKFCVVAGQSHWSLCHCCTEQCVRYLRQLHHVTCDLELYFC